MDLTIDMNFTSKPRESTSAEDVCKTTGAISAWAFQLDQYRIFFKYFTNWSQWSQFSHCFSGWFLNKKRHLLWLNCLQHDPSSTVTPTSFNDPSTPKHLLLSFLLKSNNFIQQEFSEFTWPADNGIIFFSKGESKPKPSHGRCRLADPRGQRGHCAIGGG